MSLAYAMLTHLVSSLRAAPDRHECAAESPHVHRCGKRPATAHRDVGCKRILFLDWARVVHTIRPMPEKMSSAQTASSNWRSESRLNMFKPNHVPRRAGGTKTSTFQSICATVEDAGRMR